MKKCAVRQLAEGGFAKLNNLWQGWQGLFQTFEDEADVDMDEIRDLLDEPCDGQLVYANDMKELATSIPGFVLRELTASDAPMYYALVYSNREHLTRKGDYSEYKHVTLSAIRAELGNPEGKIMFVGWLNGHMVGRFDLIPKDPGIFVLGYWLDEKATGKGLATEACVTLVDYGRTHLGLTDVWAGVTKGNDESVGVLSRLGLKPVKDMGSYVRFHRSFGE